MQKWKSDNRLIKQNSIRNEMKKIIKTTQHIEWVHLLASEGIEPKSPQIEILKQINTGPFVVCLLTESQPYLPMRSACKKWKLVIL